VKQIVGVILGQIDITIFTAGVARQALHVVRPVFRPLAVHVARRPVFQSLPQLIKMAGAHTGSTWFASHQEPANNNAAFAGT